VGCKNPYLLGPIFSWKSIFGLFLVSSGDPEIWFFGFYSLFGFLSEAPA
jgi:hypothetical protein